MRVSEVFIHLFFQTLPKDRIYRHALEQDSRECLNIWELDGSFDVMSFSASPLRLVRQK